MNQNNKKILEIIYESGLIAQKYFNNKNNIIKFKKDKSPISKADTEINKYLEKNIKKIYKNALFLSEEDTYKKQISAIEKKEFFIIDPIDGTSSFLEGSKDFTINVSYIKNNILQFSSIYIPMYDIMYFADNKDSFKISSKKSFLENNIFKLNDVKNIKNNIVKIITTKRKNEIEEIKKYLLNSYRDYQYFHISSSKKFSDLSEGIYDIYIRKAQIKLWDVVAGFHLTNNVGLEILDMSGNNLFEIFLNKNYLSKIVENNFRVDEFIIKPKNLKIF